MISELCLCFRKTSSQHVEEVSMWKSAIKRRHRECKYRRFGTRCKPSASVLCTNSDEAVFPLSKHEPHRRLRRKSPTIPPADGRFSVWGQSSRVLCVFLVFEGGGISMWGCVYCFWGVYGFGFTLCAPECAQFHRSPAVEASLLVFPMQQDRKQGAVVNCGLLLWAMHSEPDTAFLTFAWPCISAAQH